jgi:hypothetical protein
MTPIRERIEAFDPRLFSAIESQTTDWDRRALLALHAAAASVLGSFTYLEIGSYRGGSLQAVMQDERCAHVLSIDPRPADPPDKRPGSMAYEDNSTAGMRALLSQLPAADMDKLATFERGTDALTPSDLPVKPDYCFIDGEHTDLAVLRDARFCAEALHGAGVIAFHDSDLLEPAIRSFVRDVWADVSFGVAFEATGGGGGVFALELGDRGILRSPLVARAIGSRWHSVVWRRASGFRRSPVPFLLAWSAMPVIDLAIVRARAWGQRPS